MSVDDLESIEATLELLADPGAQRRLRKAQRDIEAGPGVDADALRAAMDSHRDGRR